jgi:glycosyltransferase involved in cell wall biosynthesis
VAPAELPSFDLVLATVDRAEKLGGLLASLERQTHRAFRVLLVDQNDDDRLDEVLRGHGALEVERLRSPRGLSRARNVALGQVRADLVAFPDDDCAYPDDLLERVARRFAADPTLDGLTGRAADAEGSSSASWARDAARLTRENLWNRGISFTIFLRSSLVEAVGEFDEQLGLGSGEPWSSGEETDYLVRALEASARIEYDPDLVVLHADKMLSPASLRAAGAHEGASIGYILRKHRYPRRTVGRMLVRPIGGAVLALARRDGARAQFHLSTLRGRLRGYRSNG